MDNSLATSDPRTKVSLENLIKITFFPFGARRFMKGVNEGLNLNETQSSINLGIADSFDLTKYLPYLAFAYRMIF